MDPTIELIKVRDSFRDETIEVIIPAPFSFGRDLLKFVPRIEVGDSSNLLVNLLVDGERYEELQRLKDQLDNPEFEKARLRANPFENIGRSIFIDRAGVKLANIDAVLDITGHKGGFLAKQTIGRFSFCDVAGAPGAWTQYIQFRRPETTGYGISLKSGIDWKRKEIDMDRFNITYGQDGTGDIYTNAIWFSKFVKEVEVNGVDFVGGDGGFSVEGQEREQEYLMTRLILSEVLIGLLCLKIGGTLVVKVYDTVSKFMADLLFITANCFENIWLFKPISSRPANSERYLVAKGLRGNIQEYTALLTEVYLKYQESDKMVTQIVEELPDNFTSWLTNINMTMLNYQMDAIKNIIALMSGQSIQPQLYNVYKALILWNLPDNIPPKSYSITR